MSQNGIATVAVIGDSIVHGQVDHTNGGWVTQLKLWFEGLKVYNSVFNLGIVGQTTLDVYNRLSLELVPREVELVILAVGVNDIRREGSNGQPELSLSDSMLYFSKIVEELRHMKIQVIVLGMFPIDESRTTPFEDSGLYFVGTDQLELHKAQKTWCEENGIEMLDILDHWGNKNIADYSFEGLHPNSDGHRLIFEIVKSKLQSNHGIVHL